MSLMTRKDHQGTTGRSCSPAGGASQKARAAAQTAAQVVPIAKNAGLAARQGAEGAARWAAPQVEAARTWAEPQVQAARSWAAPRVEQAGLAVRDRIAPTVSDALVEASHRLDGAQQQQRRRRWPRRVAGIAMLAAAASAVAAVMLRRQAQVALSLEDQAANGAGGPAAGQGDGATRAAGEPPRGQGSGLAGGADPGSDDLLP